MEQHKEQDLVIAGSGSSGGGSFRNVKIDGFGTLLSDTECIDFQINGKGGVKGYLRANDASISGSCHIDGNVDVAKFKISGEAKVDGNLTYRELECSGSTRVKGSATGDHVRVEGGFHVDGDSEAETFAVKGVFQIGGLLNAGNVDITMYGPCKAQEIGGEKISVCRSGLKSLLNPFLPKFVAKQLTVDTIEGDEIELEYTTAKMVRGSRITVGPGCIIDCVEYKESFIPDKNAKIMDAKQI
ncbi:polymer-forming cytoskeletal protein [Paenibacillus sp. RC67]|uniref:polymer-forming cytoskeletal protein n=1 Tax=Paenibacillus sp. RC67 TaxID=3039392 RepID=UPI0024AD8EC9|nr:polymer-forming cytoskeletal protein [Paenibacillus sp. RC67]